MAQAVGTLGLAVLRGLAADLGVVALGLTIHVYQSWVVFVARVPLRASWGAHRAPPACAAGVGNGRATPPVTLRSLRAMGISTARRGCPPAWRRTSTATNLDDDGILLYEAMAALIVAQAFGIPTGLGAQLMVAATCVLASVGIAGSPRRA